ncbi:MAG: hypothetical protein BWY35_02396 [Firmicutes bacterium ADurb.Bin248]|nr:MAG: hypothetical protein BWY35_02396 [Firmicutes bacterium ADurb.Bin248]
MPRPSRSASSAITRATVRIVPSLGFMTALYAVSAPERSALMSKAQSMSSAPSIARAQPRSIWLNMTPEFPRAPFRAPRAIAFAMSPTLIAGFCCISLTAEVIVCDMFVPVSPSGTGNTFSASTLSRFWVSSAAPD